MFARALPRAAVRASRFQCEALPRSFKLPARSWPPVSQHQLGKRYRSSMRDVFRENYKRSPIIFPFAVGCVLVLSGIAVIYVPWYYQNVIVRPYHNFPEPVAKKLRRAIYYSRGSNVDLREANKYFRQALQAATELGMDAFSPEILGVKYAISQLFEAQGHYPLACDVLEIMRVDCRRWIDEFGDRHWRDGERARVLKVLVQLDVKLGDLYLSKYMNQPEDAEKRLVEAVETALGEQMRRENEGVKEGEGEWLTDQEMGGALESLATCYEQNDQHYLATPLFLQALTLCPPKSCHGVILMNNISTCLAQQTPPPTSLPPSSSTSPSKPKLALSPQPSPPGPASHFPTTPSPSRPELIRQAEQWANKAIARAATIAPPDRDDECDIGCAVATHNLAEFLEMEGKLQEARLKYVEAESLAKAVGFQEGVDNAREAVKRVESKK